MVITQDLSAILNRLSNQVWLANSGQQSPINRSNSISFGVSQIDDSLPSAGLSCGKIHEWFSRGHPACSILCALATQALIHKGTFCSVLWIGKTVWPLPQFLLNNFSNQTTPHLLLKQSIFLDIEDRKQILWASETALKSQQIAAVISFCPSLSLQLSRRLALAAEKAGTLGLIIRPFQDRLKLSAAASRWLVTPVPTITDHPVQQLELLSHKGPQALIRKWQIEVRYEQNNTNTDLRLRVLPTLVDRASTTQSKESKTQHAA